MEPIVHAAQRGRPESVPLSPAEIHTCGPSPEPS
jgi:hypothetical protein